MAKTGKVVVPVEIDWKRLSEAAAASARALVGMGSVMQELAEALARIGVDKPPTTE